MANSEKVVFGATIERPTQVGLIKDALASIPPTSAPETRGTPGLPTDASANEPSDPFDNFYTHMDGPKTQTDLKAPSNVYVHDIESQRELGLSRTQTSKYSYRKTDSAWPSMESLRAKAKEQKRAKSRNPLRKVSPRIKWIVSGLIAVLVIGAAIGIGVGVSKAVGGGVNNMRGGSRPIGSSNDETKH